MLISAGVLLRDLWTVQRIRWRLAESSGNYDKISIPDDRKPLFERNGLSHHVLVDHDIPIDPLVARVKQKEGKKLFISASLCLAAIQYADAYEEAAETVAPGEPVPATFHWSHGLTDWQSKLAVPFSSVSQYDRCISNA